MCPGVCRVLIGLDIFWSRIRSLKHLGALLLTCKTIRAECDLMFAVASMGERKIVSKMWAKRWLGLSMSWMYIGEKHLTLVAALRIAAAHGGLAVTRKRAIDCRQKEERARADKRVQRNKELRGKDEQHLNSSKLDILVVQPEGLLILGKPMRRIVNNAAAPIGNVVGSVGIFELLLPGMVDHAKPTRD
jgi:hypothetical protein